MSTAAVGVVVIGRNEGERLRRCLRSLDDVVGRTVYVDSGSTDDSVAFARGIGACVVVLDAKVPFTAARARNEGLCVLAETHPAVEFVQFVDGDCEVEPGWIERATAELTDVPGLAVVFGRRRERQREASVYNTLCDLEWDVPVGDVASCGGDAMMRVGPVRAIGGYDPSLIAGEEPDLCRRLRSAGWGIRRVDAAMTVHDAAMYRIGQWWRRAQRSGYVEAEGVARFGRDYPRWRSAVSAVAAALVLPVAAGLVVLVGLSTGSVLLALGGCVAPLLLYFLQYRRILARASQRWSRADAALYSRYCILGKWPAVHGMATYWWRRLTRRRRVLIEYKQ